MADKPSAVEIAQDLLAKVEEYEDPWLMSYADLVTNLLAFMVLLVSMAGVSFESMDAIENVFTGDERPPALKTLSAEIMKLAEEEGLTGNVATDVDEEGLAIQLQDRILFPSGVAGLSDDGLDLVAKLARLLGKLPDKYRVTVEGHTDDVPISTPRFRSNWDLAAARALEVRTQLERSGVPDRRLAIAAFADTRPIKAPANLDQDERRRRNRRVVIRVYF